MLLFRCLDGKEGSSPCCQSCQPLYTDACGAGLYLDVHFDALGHMMCVWVLLVSAKKLG